MKQGSIMGDLPQSYSASRRFEPAPAKRKVRQEGAEILPFFIYLCGISSALMYIICQSQVVLCSIIMTVFSSAVYLVFYALRKNKVVSFFAAIAGSVMIMVMLNLVVGMQDIYNYFLTDNHTGSFMDFIFTASQFFNPVYAAAAIFIFGAIVGFVCCYFSVYAPRPCFLLLPSFIPLILSVRTSEGIPAPLLVLLLSGFIMSAVCIARPEHAENVEYNDDKASRADRLKAVGVIGVVAAILLAVIPRSDKTPYGEYIDRMFANSGSGGYYAVSATLSNFLSSSSVNRGNNTPTGNLLFVVRTEEPTLITRWAFDKYNGENGWTTLSQYETGYSGWESPAMNRNAATLVYKLKNAVENGALSDYAEVLKKIPYSYAGSTEISNEVFSPYANMTIRIANGSTSRVILHPSTSYGINFYSADPTTYRTLRNEIFSDENLPANAGYSLSYYCDKPNKEFIEAVAQMDYPALLSDALAEDIITFSEFSALYEDYSDAQTYKREALDTEIKGWDEIVELAEEITDGCSNDYEKALAIERWFADAGFVYDMSFTPKRAEVDYFLFESRRGICSDFAAAATLIARAAGLSARYTEGFVLTDEILQSDGLYHVTDAQSHAYASIYIKGYGWYEADGTRYVIVDSHENKMTFLPLIITVVVAAAGVLIFLFRRQIADFMFPVIFPLMKPEKAVRTIYLRTRAIACRIRRAEPSSMTTGETYDILRGALGMEREAGEICSAADELLYGSGTITAEPKHLWSCYKDIKRMKRKRGK